MERVDIEDDDDNDDDYDEIVDNSDGDREYAAFAERKRRRVLDHDDDDDDDEIEEHSNSHNSNSRHRPRSTAERRPVMAVSGHKRRMSVALDELARVGPVPPRKRARIAKLQPGQRIKVSAVRGRRRKVAPPKPIKYANLDVVVFPVCFCDTIGESVIAEMQKLRMVLKWKGSNRTSVVCIF